MSGEFVLYNYFRSSTSFRARIALNLKNVPFTYRAVNLLKGEHHSPEYRELNPMGGVPTLAHAGRLIPDSFAIIEYLEEIIPQPALLPPDPYLRARIKQVCEIINSSIHPMGNLKLLQYLERQHGYTQEQKEAWVQHWAAQGLEALEKNLSPFAGTYCFNNQVTMADIFLVPQVVTCLRFKVDMSRYPLIMKVYDNCLKLEAFAKAHPFHQIDTPEDLKA